MGVQNCSNKSLGMKEKAYNQTMCAMDVFRMWCEMQYEMYVHIKKLEEMALPISHAPILHANG